MPWLRSSANKVQTNAFCCCLIVNYGVALHRTCYTIVCRNRHGIFWGLIFVQGFFWVLLEALGIFLGLNFWLHSIIPVTWNPEYPPPGIASYQLLLKQDRVLVKQSTYFFDRWIWNFFFFFLLFEKNGSVGRWETKVTFYWDGLSYFKTFHRELFSFLKITNSTKPLGQDKILQKRFLPTMRHKQ